MIKKKLCDGEWIEEGKNEPCCNDYDFLARDPEDPAISVFYCCKEHEESYRRAGFIIESR